MKTAFLSLVVLSLACVARAELKREMVDYKSGDTALQGFLVYDDKIQGKRPGVLVHHEWGGLNDFAKGRAEELAKLGYVAFAADVYGKGVQARSVEESAKMSGALKKDVQTLRGRATVALDVLKNSTHVDPQRLAAMGYCFGGTTALELARGGADLKGVVSFHGALVTPVAEDAKNIKAKVLVLHGGEDPFVPDKEVAEFVESMRRHRINYQINIYGGAVHSFTNPDAARAGLKGVAYHEQADRRSWAEMKIFFDEVFRK